MNRKLILPSLSLLVMLACSLPAVAGTPTLDVSGIAATQTAAALLTEVPPGEATAIVPETAPPTAAPPPSGEAQLLAYVSAGQLLVSDVTGGVQGGTTQYTLSGESDQVTDLAWSPSGELVAFVSAAGGEPHIFYIFALGQSSPVDLGPGSSPAWSPDSQSIAYVGGAFPDENIWITTVENPAPRQLTFESNFAWGDPVFTPDGESLIVAGANRDTLGASGNTNFRLEYLELDGSGLRTPLTGVEPFEGLRLPSDMRFSPDGTWLAYSSSYHLSACASPGAYYVTNADGSGFQALISPSLQAAIDPSQEHYHVGLSYGWMPSSDAIAALGNVVDCKLDSPTAGQVIAGPQMSIVGLDGSERAIIPGFFYGISADRSGTLIAAAHFQDGFQDTDPDVEIYSAQDGQLLLTLGPGSEPRFQP
jgi:Tol biopolymer transport system component